MHKHISLLHLGGSDPATHISDLGWADRLSFNRSLRCRCKSAGRFGFWDRQNLSRINVLEHPKTETLLYKLIVGGSHHWSPQPPLHLKMVSLVPFLGNVF